MRQQLVRSVVVLLLLCSAQLASAQTAHPEVVADVVNDLRARGVNLDGPCGAETIVERVAWRLRGEGAGLLYKVPPSNSCRERAPDIVMYASGRIVDVLEDGGGKNGPQWDASKAPVDPGLWRPVLADPDGAAPPPPPPPPPGGGPVQTLNLQPALDRIASAEGTVLQRIAEAESEAKNRADATDKKIDDLREAATGGLRDFGMFVLKYVVPAIAGVTAGVMVH